MLGLPKGYQSVGVLDIGTDAHPSCLAQASAAARSPIWQLVCAWKPAGLAFERSFWAPERLGRAWRDQAVAHTTNLDEPPRTGQFCRRGGDRKRVGTCGLASVSFPLTEGKARLGVAASRRAQGLPVEKDIWVIQTLSPYSGALRNRSCDSGRNIAFQRPIRPSGVLKSAGCNYDIRRFAHETKPGYTNHTHYTQTTREKRQRAPATIWY